MQLQNKLILVVQIILEQFRKLSLILKVSDVPMKTEAADVSQADVSLTLRSLQVRVRHRSRASHFPEFQNCGTRLLWIGTGRDDMQCCLLVME